VEGNDRRGRSLVSSLKGRYRMRAILVSPWLEASPKTSRSLVYYGIVTLLFVTGERRERRIIGNIMGRAADWHVFSVWALQSCLVFESGERPECMRAERRGPLHFLGYV